MEELAAKYDISFHMLCNNQAILGDKEQRAAVLGYLGDVLSNPPLRVFPPTRPPRATII